MTTGEKIREQRKKRGLTQSKLAKAIGVDRVTVTKYENGSINPPILKIDLIAKELNCDIVDLLFDVPESFETPEVFDAQMNELKAEGEKSLSEYMQKLSSPVSNLNKLGRVTLLDIAEMMSRHEKYSSAINIAVSSDGSKTITFGKQDK